MANQIVVSSGAKVRNLEGVLTGTSGVVSSVPLGAANGVATLDSGGKVPVSQLPSSVVTYLGTWNAATNTPTLVNGTGDAGDLYLCNVAGTVNFGAGPIVFVIGDWVLYGSGTWQKSNGQNGTVTSVAASITGNSLAITGSPITTAGTLAFAFAGTNLQYVNGAGNLITFPSLTGYVPYTGATGNVDLGSNVLSAKTFTANGYAGSSGSLHLKQNNTINVAGVNYGTIATNTLQQFVFYWENSSFAKRFNLDFSALSALGTAITFSLPNTSGTIALTSDISYPVTSVFARTGAVVATSGDYTTTLVTEGTNLYYTDVRARASNSFVAGSGAYNSTTGVITIPTNNNQITNGAAYITLGSLSATSPIFYNSTTGVISSQAASVTLSGYLTSTDWSTFNSKESALTFSSPLVRTTNTISISAATTSVNGYLTSTDWNTFNNKQNALTNPVTGTGASGRVALWSGTTTQTSSVGLTFDSTNAVLTSGTYYSYNNVGAAYNLSSNGDNVGKIQNVTALSWALAYGGSSSIYPLGTAVLTWDTTNKVTFAGTLSNGTYTYTLPSATGTLALTSSLSSYLPLTGGTLTGQLYINPTNTATVGLDVASDTIRFRSDNLEGFKRQLYIKMGSGTLIQFTASGFGGTYGTDLAFYTSSASGVNGSPAMYITGGNQIGIRTGSPAFDLDVAGTGRFTGALSGTSATFSGNVGIGTTSPNAKVTIWTPSTTGLQTALRLNNPFGFANQNTGAQIVFSQDRSTAEDLQQGIIAVGQQDAGTSTTSYMSFSTNNTGLTEKMRITSGGNVGIGTTSPFSQGSGATTMELAGNVYGQFFVSANSASIRGVVMARASTLNDVYIASITNSPLLFGTNDSERMRITSGGYVYLGKGYGGSNHRINLEVAQGNTILVVSAYSGSSNDTALFYGASGANPSASGTAFGITTNSSTGRSISAGGTINASGADYAEYMFKAITDSIAKGDIVGVNIDGKLTNIFNDAISFVVKSTDPSYVGGDVWGNEDALGEKRPQKVETQTEEEFASIMEDFETRLEVERQKVDRIAFSGQVPCNVYDANVGDYIIPIDDNGKIKGQAITNPTYEQYQISVGKVWKIMEDGRAWIAVKIG